MDKNAKCDHCDAPAVITDVIVKDGEKVEHNLCEQCAAEMGISIQSHTPINELITNFVMSHSGSKRPETKSASCECCGLTFAEFRKSGTLGCPGCYFAFEAQLGALIERAHEGGTHHIGKVPKRAGVDADRQVRVATLRRQLSDAIDSEQYERAAALRDEILQFEHVSETSEGAAQERGGGESAHEV